MAALTKLRIGSPVGMLPAMRSGPPPEVLATAVRFGANGRPSGGFLHIREPADILNIRRSGERVEFHHSLSGKVRTALQAALGA
jgi:hypothetical protein